MAAEKGEAREILGSSNGERKQKERGFQTKETKGRRRNSESEYQASLSSLRFESCHPQILHDSLVFPGVKGNPFCLFSIHISSD